MTVPLRRNREYAALWIGQATSNLGISMSSFAYPLVVLAATGSAVKAGLVGTVLAGTAFVLRVPAGLQVDRRDRRKILIACDAGRALNSAGFAVALALGRFSFPHVLVVAFVEAALGVLFGPAEAAAVRRVVAREQIREAVAVNASRTAVPGLLGPPLGGVLFAAGRALPFLADAVTYLVSLACVASVRSPLQDDRAGPRDRRPLSELLEGFRWIRRHRFLRWLLGWFTGASVVFSSLGLVIIVLARNRGASPRELGAMFALTAVGGVVGALATPGILRRVQPYVLVSSFAWLATAATFALLVLHSPYAIGAAGAVAFLLAPSVSALAFAVIAEEAPDAVQGRVTSAGIQTREPRSADRPRARRRPDRPVRGGRRDRYLRVRDARPRRPRLEQPSSALPRPAGSPTRDGARRRSGGLAGRRLARRRGPVVRPAPARRAAPSAASSSALGGIVLRGPGQGHSVVTRAPVGMSVLAGVGATHVTEDAVAVLVDPDDSRHPTNCKSEAYEDRARAGRPRIGLLA